MRQLQLVVGVGVLAAAVLALLRLEAPAAESAPQASSKQALTALSKLPLTFVPNAGQTDPRVRYSAQQAGMSVFFTRSEVALAFSRGKQGQALALGFVGGKPTAIEGRRLGQGKVNYMLGNDPAKWHTGLSTYGEVVYRNLWPGVDMSFRGAAGKLEYEFLIRPGADVSDLRLAYRGSSGLSLDKKRNLRIRTRSGVLTDIRPFSYQLVAGKRVPVDSHFVLGANGAFGFAVGSYDRSRPLVIDPGLVYSTFLGGSGNDVGNAVAVDSAGNAYVTGSTLSANFPTTLGALDTSFGDAGNSDAFVTKLNASGSAPLVYSTFLGGTATDAGNAIAVDSNGSAYVTGTTGGSYPIQADPLSGLPFPWQPSYGGGSSDAFVTKLNPTGAGLVFSTYAGGSLADQGWGIAVHSSGDVYVTGDTASTNFPHTASALQATRSGNSDAFFLRLDRFGAGAGYSSYVGGNADDSARAIAIDSTRNVYLTGLTTSTNFSSAGAAQTTYGGGQDAFVRKLTFVSSINSNDTYSIGYSTYLGGTALEQGFGIAIDTAGSAYAAGLTRSTNFPVTGGSFPRGGGTDEAFVTKLNAAGSARSYSTYLGGSADERIQAIALDAANDAHVVGWTTSSNFPTTPGAFDTSSNGGRDAFVTKLNPTGGGPLYSTFLGGSGGSAGNNDQGTGIALDANANAYVTGLANSSDFPTTPGAFDTTQNGGSDVFVTKLDMIGAPYSLTLAPATATNTVGNPHTVTATVRDFGGTLLSGITVRFSVTGANPGSGSDTTDANGEATFTYTGTVAGGDTITAFADTNNNSTRQGNEPQATATKTWNPGTPTTLTLAPSTATNVVDTQHCVTATVQDVYGNAVPGVTVRFSVPTAVATAASPASGSAVTNASGQAGFCYTAQLPGEDMIHAYADTDNSTTEDLNEPFADATKTWTTPPSTDFCEASITNGGSIVASNGDPATFGGNAKVSGDGSVQGHEEYHDHGPAAPINVASIQLAATTCSSNRKNATIFGTATIDGDGTHVFRIDLVDEGSTGKSDKYGIILDTGYASGQQQLKGGNITIHKP